MVVMVFIGRQPRNGVVSPLKGLEPDAAVWAEQFFKVEELPLQEKRRIWSKRSDEHSCVGRSHNLARIMVHRPRLPIANLALEQLARAVEPADWLDAFAEIHPELANEPIYSPGHRAKGEVVVQEAQDLRSSGRRDGAQDPRTILPG